MAYDIRLVKLITGELVLGKHDAENDKLLEVATLQTVPTQQGVQMMMLPYGYPFEQDFTGEISCKHVLYEYKSAPEDLKTKYMEAISNLTLSSGGLGGLNLGGASAGAGGSKLSNVSELLRK